MGHVRRAACMERVRLAWLWSSARLGAVAVDLCELEHTALGPRRSHFRARCMEEFRLVGSWSVARLGAAADKHACSSGSSSSRKLDLSSGASDSQIYSTSRALRPLPALQHVS